MLDLNSPGPSPGFSRRLAIGLVSRMNMDEHPLHPVAAGATVMWAGDSVTRLPFLEVGRIDAVLHLQGADGGHVVPISFGDGEIVGLSRLFGDEPGQLDLVAVTNLQMRWIPIAEIERTLVQHQDLLVLLVQFLASRLREVQRREVGWVERGVHERLCAALARLAQECRPSAGARWLIPSTHEALAARCGVSRPKVSSELKRLEKAGRLRLTRGVIELLDVDGILRP